MKLKNGLNFPQDFIKYKDLGNGFYSYEGKDFEFNRLGSGKQVVQVQHHPITLLLPTIISYDLTDRKEKSEFLALISVALYIDDYNLLSDKQSKVTGVIHELAGATDLNDFIDKLEEAEKSLDNIAEIMDLPEVKEMRAEQAREANVLQINTKPVKKARKKRAKGGK